MKDLFLWPLASRLFGLQFIYTVTLKNGLVMKGDMEDILNRFIIFIGPFITYFWEPATMRLLEVLAQRKQGIVMAGSHIGYTVLSAARVTNGHIYAFEPVSGLYKRSQENFALNPNVSSKITLEKKALGNTNGEVTMYVENIRSSIIPYSKNHVAARTEQVPITTLDAYADSQAIKVVDLIFLDIEGYELYALQGAQRMLQQKPDLILEVSPRVMSKATETVESLYAFLENIGYDIYIIIDNYTARITRVTPQIKLIPLRNEHVSQYIDSDYFNIFATVQKRELLQREVTIVE